jgi:transcriptional regulator NrdR family protein
MAASAAAAAAVFLVASTTAAAVAFPMVVIAACSGIVFQISGEKIRNRVVRAAGNAGINAYADIDKSLARSVSHSSANKRVRIVAQKKIRALLMAVAKNCNDSAIGYFAVIYLIYFSCAHCVLVLTDIAVFKRNRYYHI